MCKKCHQILDKITRFDVCELFPSDPGHEMADKILSEIRKRVPESITRLLPAEELDPAVLFLLQHVQDTITKDGK
jgi:hypothetical protein